MNNRDVPSIEPYVSVFYKLYMQDCTSELYEKLERYGAVLGQFPALQTALTFDLFCPGRAYTFLEHIAAVCDVEAVVTPLLKSAAKQKCLCLIQRIILAALQRYKTERHIIDLSIISASALSVVQLEHIAKWVADERGAKKVRIIQSIDPSLIAGFRLESEHFFGDYSVQEQLRMLSQHCV